MKSAALGPSTSLAEVTNVSPHGFWLFIGERELFVPFTQFPWFREASVREITNVQLPGPHHLTRWSVRCSLDVCRERRSAGHQRSARAAAAETPQASYFESGAGRVEKRRRSVQGRRRRKHPTRRSKPYLRNALIKRCM
jgi:hypothetical protein